MVYAGIIYLYRDFRATTRIRAYTPGTGHLACNCFLSVDRDRFLNRKILVNEDAVDIRISVLW